MTRNQVRWAATHDWFLSSTGAGRRLGDTTHHEVTVRDVQVNVTTGAVTERLRYFTDFRSLYAWAGY